MTRASLLRGPATPSATPDEPETQEKVRVVYVQVPVPVYLERPAPSPDPRSDRGQVEVRSEPADRKVSEPTAPDRKVSEPTAPRKTPERKARPAAKSTPSPQPLQKPKPKAKHSEKPEIVAAARKGGGKPKVVDQPPKPSKPISDRVTRDVGEDPGGDGGLGNITGTSKPYEAEWGPEKKKWLKEHDRLRDRSGKGRDGGGDAPAPGPGPGP